MMYVHLHVCVHVDLIIRSRIFFKGGSITVNKSNQKSIKCKYIRYIAS